MSFDSLRNKINTASDPDADATLRLSFSREVESRTFQNLSLDTGTIDPVVNTETERRENTERV